MLDILAQMPLGLPDGLEPLQTDRAFASDLAQGFNTIDLFLLECSTTPQDYQQFRQEILWRVIDLIQFVRAADSFKRMLNISYLGEIAYAFLIILATDLGLSS